MNPPRSLLSVDSVRVGARPEGKVDAIEKAGAMLVAAGCVEPAYVASMVRREEVANTFLGSGVAIPHGLGEDRGLVRRDGLSVVQVPGGLEWNEGQTAHLVVGIAAHSDSHIAVLRRLTRLMQDESRLKRLFATTDPAEIVAALLEEAAPAAVPAAADLAERVEWTLDYPVGLHARPASVWVEAARAETSPIRVRHGEQAADARSLVSLLQLGLKAGDLVTFSASGPDAAAVLARFRAVAAGLSEQEKAQAELAARRAAAPARGWNPPGAPRTIVGIGASPGLAIGRIHLLAPAEPQVPDKPVGLAEGGVLLNDALVRTRQQLTALVDDTARRLGAAEAGIFKAQAALLDDADLIALTCRLMVEGHGVAWAWNMAVERMAGQLSALGNPALAARAADLRDVGRRVLAQLEPSLGAGSPAALPEGPVILVAADLAPSDTAGLDTGRVVGLATALGGPTAHTAILARTLGLPAMVAGGAELLRTVPGTEAIVDGEAGRIYLAPSAEAVASARSWMAGLAEKRAAEEAERALPARTRDGHSVAIGANVNRPDQVPLALAQGAEGVGLMRTEFLFLERAETPDEEEQYAIYRAMIDALGEERPLIVRALDIGGDKQVAHLRLPQEKNPFLGVRGARLLLRRLDLLDPQLRALYRAAGKGGKVSIMFPMVTSVAELLALRGHCERIRMELRAPRLPVGIMIEVPAAALQAGSLAAHVDFFSVGTNDLTQYALAIDRQNPELAREADSLHPAVLRLIAMTVEGARRHGRWVGVCGGLAGDPFGATLLAGLGVSELSMTPRDIPAVKARLRAADLGTFEAMAARALEAETADQVRAIEGTVP